MKTNIIYNEDCFVTMANMPDKSIDVIFTSPPYNRKRNDKYKFFNDINLDYYEFLSRGISEMMRISDLVFVNIMKNYYNKSDVFKIIGEFSDSLFDIFIWEKSNPLPANGFNITNAYEFVLVFADRLKSNTTYTKNHIITSVARMPKEHRAVMHPDVADFFIGKFTKEGDIVYDPFMGLGTTALTCIKHNRKFIGSEICKEYFDMCNDRIENA